MGFLVELAQAQAVQDRLEVALMPCLLSLVSLGLSLERESY